MTPLHRKSALGPWTISYTISSTQKIRRWKDLLKSRKCKTSIINFLVEELQCDALRQKLGRKELFLGWSDKCIKIGTEGVLSHCELNSDQEEADGRLLLHSKDASQYFDTVIIVARDSDVFVLALSFSHMFQNYF